MECFDTGAVFSVPNSNAWWCLYASCNGTEATIPLSLYIHIQYTYSFTYVYLATEREREQKHCTKHQSPIYVSCPQNGFPLISSLLNKVQKIIAGWHRWANSKPSTGFSAPSNGLLNNRLPSSETPRKIAAWKLRAWEPENATLPGNFPNTNPAAHRHPPPLSSRS